MCVINQMSERKLEKEEERREGMMKEIGEVRKNQKKDRIMKGSHLEEWRAEREGGKNERKETRKEEGGKREREGGKKEKKKQRRAAVGRKAKKKRVNSNPPAILTTKHRVSLAIARTSFVLPTPLGP